MKPGTLDLFPAVKRDELSKSYVAPIPGATLKNMEDGEMKVKDYKKALADVDARFQYVLPAAMAILGRKINWYDYDNGSNTGDSSGDGRFEIERYSEEIGFEGDFKVFDTGKDVKTLYEDSIPTRWLTEDFEAGLAKEVKEEKERVNKAAARRAQEAIDLNTARENIITQIKAKLSQEELSYVAFLDTPRVEPNKKKRAKPTR